MKLFLNMMFAESHNLDSETQWLRGLQRISKTIWI